MLPEGTSGNACNETFRGLGVACGPPLSSRSLMVTFAAARTDWDCCRGDNSAVFLVRLGVVGKKARCFLPGDPAMLLGVVPALLLTAPLELRRENASL